MSHVTVSIFVVIMEILWLISFFTVIGITILC